MAYTGRLCPKWVLFSWVTPYNGLYREALPEMGTVFSGSPYNDLYEEALPKRGTFFRGTPYGGIYMGRLCLKGVSFFRGYSL